MNPTNIHSKEKWQRISSDFAKRRVERVEDVIGELAPGRKKAVRSYFYQMAILKKEMNNAEWIKWTEDKNNIPPEVQSLEKQL